MSSSLRKHPFRAKRPSGEERGETDVFTEVSIKVGLDQLGPPCLLYTSPSPRDATLSRMPSSA